MANRPTALSWIPEHVRDGIVLQDIFGCVEWINPACEKMFGWTLEEFLGRKPLEFLAPPEQKPSREDVDSFRYRPNTSLFEGFRLTEHVRKDGSRLWNQQSFSLIRTGPDVDDLKVIITCRDVTDQVQTEKALRKVQVELEQAANHDALTGLANRKRLKEFLRSEQVLQHISNGELGVLQLDIDKFKHINDTLGHAAGDATLDHVASAMRNCSKAGDLVCRTGGDEFLLLCSGVSDELELLRRAEEVRKVAGAPFVWENQQIEVGISIGVSLSGKPATSGESLIQMADQALYEAKGRGRDQVVFYTERLGQAQRAQIRLIRDLRRAIQNDEFEVYFQPQICLRRNCVIGAEALLRWNHPETGLRLPGEFLVAAENNGLVADIDYLAMTHALDGLVELRKAGFDDMRLALNVSSSILADNNYPGLLDWAMQARGIPPDHICIEILETTIVDHAGIDVITAISRLKRLGVTLALDDFGTGYAGLAHLAALDVDQIKLDGTMIRRLEDDTRNRAVVRSIIRLCALLGMKVVAEGVETEGQIDILRRTSCPAVQGFGFARPMPVQEMVQWMRDGAPYAISLPKDAMPGDAEAHSPR